MSVLYQVACTCKGHTCKGDSAMQGEYLHIESQKINYVPIIVVILLVYNIVHS